MTSTDICNMALSSIGLGTINSIDENTETARKCKLYYDNTRKTLLVEANWGFAKRQEKLALVSDELQNDYYYVYIYPEQCLLIRRIYEANDRSESLRKHRYQVYNLDGSAPVIATNAQVAYLEYTCDTQDATVYPAPFVEAFARLLASNLSMALVGNTGLQQMQYQLYQAALQKATMRNAQEMHRELDEPRKYAYSRGSYARARWGID